MSGRLPGRLLNSAPTEALGREVVVIETLPLQKNQRVRLSFEQVNSPWRQGVFLATDGLLRIAETASPKFVIWSDTAPPEVEISCDETTGLLTFYNVWNSRRPYRPNMESQSASSGMVAEALGDGSFRYSCNDIGSDPDFHKLVFSITVSAE